MAPGARLEICFASSAARILLIMACKASNNAEVLYWHWRYLGELSLADMHTWRTCESRPRGLPTEFVFLYGGFMCSPCRWLTPRQYECWQLAMRVRRRAFRFQAIWQSVRYSPSSLQTVCTTCRTSTSARPTTRLRAAPLPATSCLQLLTLPCCTWPASRPRRLSFRSLKMYILVRLELILLY